MASFPVAGKDAPVSTDVADGFGCATRIGVRESVMVKKKSNTGSDLIYWLGRLIRAFIRLELPLVYLTV